MFLAHDVFSDDKSERVDPARAADELIVYAQWVKECAEREAGRRVPRDAVSLLDALNDKKQGREVVLRAFQRYRPRKDWVAETKRKMALELFLDESEQGDFEDRLRS